MRQRTFGLVGVVCLSTLLGMVAGCGVTRNPNPPIPPATLAIATASPLTPGTVNAAYSLTLAATGGTAPYSWSISAGAPPPTLALSSTGVLSGTPTAAGTSTFTITVKDSSSAQQTATLAATLVIAPVKLAITTASPLPAGTLNAAYGPLTLAATGGTAPYSWSISAGALPAGLTLAATGILSGTPTASGSFMFTLQASDSASPAQTVTAPFVLQINVAALVVVTTALPTGTLGSPYAYQLTASGGVAPYTWSLGGNVPLPNGLALSPGGAISGTPLGNTPSSAAPTFTVTDSAGTTASATLTLTINPATGTIPDGHYSFVFAGTNLQGTPAVQNGIAINGTFTLQAGAVTAGFYDENTNTSPAVTEQAITGGSLNNGANGLGQLVLTTANNTLTFELATPSSVTTGSSTPIRMIGFSDATGPGLRGSGVLDPALANPTAAAISGNYAFLLSGTDIDQNEQALVCSFQTDANGHVTNGKADANQFGGNLASWATLSGGYTVDANGRGVLTIVLGGAPFHYSFYQVSPVDWLAISLDPATLNSPLVSGPVVQQAPGPFTTASLPAQSVLEISGVMPLAGGGTTPDIALGLAASNGSGSILYNFDEYAGALATGQSLSVSYAVDPTTGRTTSTGTTAEPILYIINSTSAYYLGPDRSAKSGMIEARTGAPFANASFSGAYLGGSLPLVITSGLNEDGLVTADGAGNIVLTTSRSTSAGLVLYQNVTGTYAVDSTGRIVATTPDGLTRIFYVVSPTKVAYLTSDTGGYLGSFVQ